MEFVRGFWNRFGGVKKCVCCVLCVVRLGLMGDDIGGGDNSWEFGLRNADSALCIGTSFFAFVFGCACVTCFSCFLSFCCSFAAHVFQLLFFL